MSEKENSEFLKPRISQETRKRIERRTETFLRNLMTSLGIDARIESLATSEDWDHCNFKAYFSARDESAIHEIGKAFGWHGKHFHVSDAWSYEGGIAIFGEARYKDGDDIAWIV
jgi:hypothetical protein